MTAALAQELASYIQVMQPAEDRLTLWINAMESGEYSFGYGLLRSADDVYDPMGVLAAISAPEWTWDDQEGGWAIDGDALFLPPTRVAEWLEVQTREPSLDSWAMGFQTALATVADGARGFAEVVAVLRDAQKRQSETTSRLSRLSMAELRRMPLPDMDYRLVEDRMMSHMRAGPFYALGGKW